MSRSTPASATGRQGLGSVHHHPDSSGDVHEQALCFVMMMVGMLVIIVGVVVVLGQAVLAASSSMTQSAVVANAMTMFKIAAHVFEKGAWPLWCSARHKPLWRRLVEAFCVGLTWPYWYWRS